MPTISQFYGISILMYPKEHTPPHIHAKYGDYAAVISIASGEVLEGEIPKRAERLVKEWVKEHKEELLTIWETKEFKKITPLV